MTLSLLQERPPYVQFELEPVEDRDASIKEGRYMTKDVAFAHITPAGSKDKLKREAKPWLDEIKRKAAEGSYNPEHARHFEQMFRAWEEGNEIPANGTPIKHWEMISPAQRQNLISANVRTVEDLASLNEGGLMRVGMGARHLQEQARAWLASAQDRGSVAAENAALKARVDDLESMVKQLAEQNQKLAAGRKRQQDLPE